MLIKKKKKKDLFSPNIICNFGLPFLGVDYFHATVHRSVLTARAKKRTAYTVNFILNQLALPIAIAPLIPARCQHAQRLPREATKAISLNSINQAACLK
jgi:hypothetical protein